MDIWNIAGTLGVTAQMTGFFLLQKSVLASDSMRYLLLNLVGGLLLIASLMFHQNLPALILEIMWVAIALYGMTRVMRRRVHS